MEEEGDMEEDYNVRHSSNRKRAAPKRLGSLL
jgi:hypothetical protein